MLNILLIEDEFIISKDLKIQLSKNNYAQVDTAKNYKDALHLYTQNTYDIVISDINLNGEKDGIDTVTEFSKIKKTPVVYLTAYSDAHLIERAEKTMPFAYILKPYNNIQLKTTINLAILNLSKESWDTKENTENTHKLNLLTKREKEVLIILSTGKISRDIAGVLNISVNTVEQHKKNIRKKLELKTVGELINFAMTTKMLQV